jgi:hypothetical protein
MLPLLEGLLSGLSEQVLIYIKKGKFAIMDVAAIVKNYI